MLVMVGGGVDVAFGRIDDLIVVVDHCHALCRYV
jgi:hypothetical protein